jgi:hypothetical protein
MDKIDLYKVILRIIIYYFVKNMELNLTPDIYIPSVNEDGNYIDNIPVVQNGLFCPCCPRKDKCYDTKSKFSAHIKSIRHIKWIKQLNANKANYYVELLQSKELIDNQKKIIKRLENENESKKLTIEYLTQEIKRQKTPQPVFDLLELDFN